jgi:ACS family hexuronate transporter-like MFS transporter
MPAYFQDVREFDLRMIGRFLWIPYVCARAGALIGGWLSSVLIKKGLGVDRSRKTILFSSAMRGMIGSAACFVANPFTALVLLSVALLGHKSWDSNIHTAIIEISPRQHIALLYGISGAAGTMLSALAQPFIGHVVDSAGYVPVFVGCGLTFILAAELLRAAGKIEHVTIP